MRLVKLYTTFRASLPRNPWRVNSSLTFNVTNLMRNNESQYVTAVDKPINTPRISWQACTKRSIQFDQTLSILREILGRARRD